MSLTATAHSTGDSLRQDVLIDGRHHLTTNEPERHRARAAQEILSPDRVDV